MSAAGVLGPEGVKGMVVEVGAGRITCWLFDGGGPGSVDIQSTDDQCRACAVEMWSCALPVSLSPSLLRSSSTF